MILCTDFDGTLRDLNDPAILDTNLTSLKSWREAGNQAYLITGRTYTVLGEILPDWATYFDYVATDNGGAIFHQKGYLLASFPFQTSDVDDILAIIPDGTLPVFYYPYSLSTERLPDQTPIKIRVWFHTLDDLWSEHHYLSSNFTEIKSLPWPKPGFSQLPGVDLTQYPGFIDLVPETSGKENAITHLGVLTATANLRTQFTHTNIITVGDDYNDIAMLKSFTGYAISTAPSEVIQAASGRTIHSVSELISLKMSQA